ncbi:MAG TPA: hypothetical protein VJO32_07905 [Ktedonobacteraceae bacterium]|nr:hypothetical protein [Ktedonobacteraceae bacterium]
MLSPVVTALSFCVMLLISANFIIGARRERKRQKCAGIQQLLSPAQHHMLPLQIPSMQSRNETDKGKSVPQPGFNLPHSWYTRRRSLVSLGFFVILALALFVQSGLADGALRSLSKSLSLLSESSPAFDMSTTAHSAQINASQQLVRISQLDPAQYSSPAEFNTWAYSACSAAAMTEVFNAYGRHYRVTDVLKVEAQIGEITPQLGLVRPEGIQNTAAQFGFKTTWGNNWTLDHVIDLANHSEPVIVSFPPDRYDGGHLLDVIGGNSTTVYLADTSLWNRRSLSRSQFLAWWEGYAAVVTPN